MNPLHTIESAAVSGIKAEVIGVVYQLSLRVPATHSDNFVVLGGRL